MLMTCFWLPCVEEQCRKCKMFIRILPQHLLLRWPIPRKSTSKCILMVGNKKTLVSHCRTWWEAKRSPGQRQPPTLDINCMSLVPSSMMPFIDNSVEIRFMERGHQAVLDCPTWLGTTWSSKCTPVRMLSSSRVWSFFGNSKWLLFLNFHILIINSWLFADDTTNGPECNQI